MDWKTYSVANVAAFAVESNENVLEDLGVWMQQFVKAATGKFWLDIGNLQYNILDVTKQKHEMRFPSLADIYLT